jgi:ATP-dependent RNA helicase DeaD
MRHRGEGGVWFHINIGRRANADPKWLLPVICKRGGVSREAIGSIRIFDNETKFEVSGDQAEQFAQAMTRPVKPKKGEVELFFTRMDGSAPAPRFEKGDKKPFKKNFEKKKDFEKKDFGKKPFEKKPFEKKAFGDKPPFKDGDKPKFKKKHRKGD